MKMLRIITVMLSLIITCVFVLFYVNEQLNTDNTYPAISIEGGLLEVSIHDGNEKLLMGVTAYDEKDGDLTEKVIVESVSQFTEDRICTVTYAVADSNKHVTKNTRKICYTDYEPPQFTLKEPMVFTVGKSPDIRSLVGAVDVIDGDISDKVIITATDYQSNTTGVFSLSLQATNSKGDIIYLTLPIFVEEINLRAPVIELSDYIIYVKKGEEPDFSSYIASFSSQYYTLDKDGLLIAENYDANTPGIYTVHYYAFDTLGNEGHAVLTVVVEE